MTSFVTLAREFVQAWEEIPSNCPNISNDTDVLLGKCLAWTGSCNIILEAQVLDCPVENAPDIVEVDDVRLFLTKLAQYGQLPPTETSLGCGADESSASWSRKYSASLLRICLDTLRSLCRSESYSPVKSGLRSCLPVLLYMSACHLDPQHPWSTEESSRLANQLVELLCLVDGSSDVATLLAGAMGKSVLQLLSLRLTKDSWRDHVQSVEVLLWYVSAVSREAFEDNISRLVPPLLLLVDEGEACLDLSVRGTSALHQLVDCVTEAELRRHEWLAVLHEAVKRHVYSRDAEFLSVVLPLHASFCTMMSSGQRMTSFNGQRSEGHGSGPGSNWIHIPGLEWNSMDDFLDHLLFSAACETCWNLRRVYVTNILSVLLLQGLRAVRHLRRLTELLVNYLEFPDAPDEECRFAALALLRQCVVMAWPRFAKPVAIIKALLKLCCDLTEDNAAAAVDTIDESSPVPVFWTKFCAGFELAQNSHVYEELSHVVSSGFGVARRTRLYVLLAVAECLLMLCRCSEFMRTSVKKLQASTGHNGARTCLHLVLSLAESEDCSAT